MATPQWVGRRRCERLNQINMTLQQKQQLPVQFLQFGVDSIRVSVPILRSDKHNFLKLSSGIRTATPPAKSGTTSR